MSKYSKMVESNQKASKEKIDCAIQTIKEMLEKEEQLLVCDLVRKTGLSRAFFYKNPDVSKFLNEARQQQEGKVFHQKKKVILDYLVSLNREKGSTIVITSSELTELRSMCDRIAVVYDGKVKAVLKPEDSDERFGLLMSGLDA